jgi:hypothetical protein
MEECYTVIFFSIHDVQIFVNFASKIAKLVENINRASKKKTIVKKIIF